MNISLIKRLLLITILLISEPVFAFKCGNRLVDVGDHKYKVIEDCGEPDYSETRTIKFPSHCRDDEYYSEGSPYYREHYRAPHVYRRNHFNYANCHYRTVEIWIYNRGPRKFMREFIFQRGVVKEINKLGYGY